MQHSGGSVSATIALLCGSSPKTATRSGFRNIAQTIGIAWLTKNQRTLTFDFIYYLEES
jgi:hypothetical protein